MVLSLSGPVRRSAPAPVYNAPMLTVARRVPGFFVFVVLAACGVAAACGSPTSTGTPAPVAEASPDVWAVVDGREIRRETVEGAFRRMVQPGAPMSDEEATLVKLNLLDQAITEDLLLAKAAQLKIIPTEAELDAAFNDRKKNMSDADFEAQLSSRKVSMTDVREALRRELVAQKVIEQEVGAKIVVTDKAISDFFQANKAQFNLAEDAYHLAQIVVTPVRDEEINNRTGDDATTPQAAATKAQMLMARLKENVPFSELAMDYSEDPQSAPRGGDVGLLPLSALRQAPPPLRDVALKAKPGTVSLVSIQGNHAIVALVAKQAAGQRDLSMPEVRDSITATLRGRREDLLRTAYVEAARNRATIVNYLARRITDARVASPSMPLGAPK